MSSFYLVLELTSAQNDENSLLQTLALSKDSPFSVFKPEERPKCQSYSANPRFSILHKILAVKIIELGLYSLMRSN